MKQYEQFHWRSVYITEGIDAYFLGFDDSENMLLTMDEKSAPQMSVYKYTDIWNYIKAQLDTLLTESDKSPTELKWQTGGEYPANTWILVQYRTLTGTYQALHTNTPVPVPPFPVRRWAVLS